jgi:hypothetical protein
MPNALPITSIRLSKMNVRKSFMFITTFVSLTDRPPANRATTFAANVSWPGRIPFSAPGSKDSDHDPDAYLRFSSARS